MEPIIVNKINNTLRLGNLANGEAFKWDGQVYLKTPSPHGHPMGFVLCTKVKYMMVVEILASAKVTPLKITKPMVIEDGVFVPEGAETEQEVQLGSF